MIEKEITKKIYIADEGKEFLSKEECQNYEKFVEEILSKIEYFCIMLRPDLAEIMAFQQKIYVAVYSNKHYCKEIAFNWAIKLFGYLRPSEQGYGFQPCFSLSQSNKIDFDECKPTRLGSRDLESERIFLSPIKVEGFPSNINYMREWGFV